MGGVGGDTQLERHCCKLQILEKKDRSSWDNAKKREQLTLQFANGVACLDLARVDPRVEISKVGTAFQEGSENLERS